MKQDSLMDKMLDTMIPSMGLDINNTEKMKPFMKAIKGIMTKLVDNEMVTIYDTNFEDAEINDFITFYKSSSGQKYIKAQPTIQKEIMETMMIKYMPEIMKAVEEAKK
jgi:uncharacterized protein